MSTSPSPDQPIPLPLNGTIAAVIGAAMAVESVRIALGAYIEGAGLGDHEYQLEITGARLVPVTTQGLPDTLSRRL